MFAPLYPWFARPWALAALGVLPVLTTLWAWARWRRSHALARLGNPFFVQRLALVRPFRRRLHGVAIFFGVALVVVGLAGPRWGASAETPLLAGKDVIVVLDVSRSMLAEQPSRLERAKRSLRDLADQLERRGGHRVALVLFAAHAKLAFPLTGDYQHFRTSIDTLDPDDLPAGVRPRAGEKAASGTRLGEALRLAVAAHDPQRGGWRDVILVSDGDDPAGDEEWADGVGEARQHQIPVHVVAVGDPAEPHPIPRGSDVVRFDGAVVSSALNEVLLQEIARRTGGLYFPAHTTALPLGRLLRTYLSELPDAGPAESMLVEAAPRQAWFLLPGLLLLAGSMLFGDGPARTASSAPTTKPTLGATPVGDAACVAMDPQPATQAASPTAATLAMMLLMPLLMSAGPVPNVDDLLRQGNAAFQREDYEEALKLFEQAETRTTDPGLVAFNKGATLYRLGRHAEAAAHWQRSLEDGAIPADRKARAAYDLGTALLHQAGDKNRRLLERAVAAFRQCLSADPDPDLRRDALHNLELARWLWLRARTTGSDDPPSPEQPPKSEQQPETKGNGQHPDHAKNGHEPGQHQAADKKGIDGGPFGEQKKLAQGAIVVLPDQDKLAPLTPEDSLATLERLVHRMREEGRSHRQQAVTTAPLKDW